MHRGTIYIIGAGLAGLSAATALAERGIKVVLYESTPQAGGRCRSYHDEAFGGMIDNGNHLLLSGNKAALAYLKRIGSEHAFATSGEPVFDFADAQTGARWRLDLGTSRLPFWLLDKNRRVPGSRVQDYFSILKLLFAKREDVIAPLLDGGSLLYKRLWQPLLLSALNTDLREASARLGGAVVRETLLKGGKACIPLVAHTLNESFIRPALDYLAARGADIRFNRRLRRVGLENDRATCLEFASGETVALSQGEWVVCALPSWAASELLPGLPSPNQHRGILNAHFRIAPPAGMPVLTGVVNAKTEWVFAFPDRISITISAADRLMHEDREALARAIWSEVAALTGLASALPPWQIVKEKRATFAATPEQNAKRPGTRTGWRNVLLAGDWVQTGLPSTIEGAIGSGASAAAFLRS